LLAVADDEGSVVFIRTDEWVVEKVFPTGAEEALAMSYLRNYGLVLAEAKDGTMQLRQVGASKPLLVASLDKGHTQKLAFSSDGDFIAAIVNSGDVKLYRAPSWNLIKTFTFYRHKATTVFVSQGGTPTAVGYEDGLIVLWDRARGIAWGIFALLPPEKRLASAWPHFALEGRDNPVLSLALAQNGQYLAAGTDFGLTVARLASP
jgi:WD40 repeat protein